MSSSIARRTYLVVVGVVGLAGIGFTATAQVEHVELCHKIGSPNKLYVLIPPGVNGAYHGHYAHHEDDIIPPFEFQGKSYSLNWEGPGNAVNQEIFENGCQQLAPQEEPPEVEPGPPIEEEPPFTG
jgi:hypothetical protein